MVAKGHTLGAIARRYHTTVKAIERTNRLKPGAHIYPGQKLRIVVPDQPEATGRSQRDAAGHKSLRKVSKSAKHAPESPFAAATTGTEKPGPSPPGASLHAHLAVGGEGSPQTGGRHDSTASLVDRYARKPPRPGYVTLIRFSERFTGPLVDEHRRVPPAAHARVSRLLRDLRARQQVPIDKRLLRLIADVSDHFGGRPMVVVSGFRMYSTSQYANDSRHNYGQALDFRIVGVPNEAVRDYCLRLPAVGLGYYPNSSFVHLDVRERKAMWVDRSSPGEAPRYVKRARRRKPASSHQPARRLSSPPGRKHAAQHKRHVARSRPNDPGMPKGKRSTVGRTKGRKAAAP